MAHTFLTNSNDDLFNSNSGMSASKSINYFFNLYFNNKKIIFNKISTSIANESKMD